MSGLAKMKFSASPNKKGFKKITNSKRKRTKQKYLISLVEKYQWKGIKFTDLKTIKGL